MIPTFAGFRGGLSAPAAPIMDHHTVTGQFKVTNYISTLAYTPTLISGSGTATLIDSVNGIFSLSSTTARFSVTAGYSVSAPQSVLGVTSFMQRTPYVAVEGPQEVGYLHALPPHGVNIPTTIGATWVICTDSGGGEGQECAHREGTMIKGSLPSGFTDSYGEWWRVT